MHIILWLLRESRAIRSLKHVDQLLGFAKQLIESYYRHTSMLCSQQFKRDFLVSQRLQVVTTSR